MAANLSTKRLILFTTVVLLVVIIIVAVGLGFGMKSLIKKDDDSPCTTSKTEKAGDSLSVEGSYRYGAVAADAGECSTVGTDIMAMGGSAVDIAIAAMLCACIHNLHNCGIGGGHFMTIYNREEKKAYAVMAREMAPGASTPDMFVGRSSIDGGLSIAIPGEVKGFWEAHKLAGKLPWKQLFIPSIKICKEGFRIGTSLGYQIEDKRSYFDKFENLKNMLTDPVTGRILSKGDVLKLPKLARTLEIIADEGPDAFYNGSLTQDIVDDIADAGGIVTKEDLTMYKAAVKEPLVIQIHDGLKVLSPPPPSSGAVYSLILGILDGYQFGHTSLKNDQKRIETWHRIVEAFKFAYAKRTDIGDSDAEGAEFTATLNQLIKNMTSSDFAEHIRSKISDDKTHDTEYYEPTFYSVDDAGTSHLSVLSPNGDAVSVTSTINVYFGAKVVGSRTGILFNDEMDDFSTPNTTNYFGVPASPANFIKPYKRPLSSMCPAIVTDQNGDVRLVVGSSGGTRITTSTALVTMETLWFGMSTKEAVDHRRLHHQVFPERIAVERGFSEAVISGLKKKGHNIEMRDSAGSVAQVILQDPGKLINATSDYRKHAYPDGF